MNFVANTLTAYINIMFTKRALILQEGIYANPLSPLDVSVFTTGDVRKAAKDLGDTAIAARQAFHAFDWHCNPKYSRVDMKKFYTEEDFEIVCAGLDSAVAFGTWMRFNFGLSSKLPHLDKENEKLKRKIFLKSLSEFGIWSQEHDRIMPVDQMRWECARAFKGAFARITSASKSPQRSFPGSNPDTLAKAEGLKMTIVGAAEQFVAAREKLLRAIKEAILAAYPEEGSTANSTSLTISALTNLSDASTQAPPSVSTTVAEPDVDARPKDRSISAGAPNSVLSFAELQRPSQLGNVTLPESTDNTSLPRTEATHPSPSPATRQGSFGIVTNASSPFRPESPPLSASGITLSLTQFTGDTKQSVSRFLGDMDFVPSSVPTDSSEALPDRRSRSSHRLPGDRESVHLTVPAHV